jgi:hypothetical protein
MEDAGEDRPGADEAVTDEMVRAAEDARRRERLITLKAMRARGERPAGVVHGRWLGDFLDQATDTGLKPAEEKLLAAVARGEVCDLRKPMPRPMPERLAIVRAFVAANDDIPENEKQEVATNDAMAAMAAAYVSRDWHDFHFSPDSCLDPAFPATTVRGPFVRFLALGGDGDAPVHAKGVKLFGALIEDVFDLEGARGGVRFSSGGAGSTRRRFSSRRRSRGSTCRGASCRVSLRTE